MGDQRTVGRVGTHPNIESFTVDLRAGLAVTGTAFHVAVADAAGTLAAALDVVALAKPKYRSPLLPAVASAGRYLTLHLVSADVRAAASDDLVN